MNTILGLAFIAVFLRFGAVECLTSESDVNALRLLKQFIDPITILPNSYVKSWNFSMDPCESRGWFLGVLCTDPIDESSNKRVSTILLDAVGYDGFLPSAIGDLTELTELRLDSNRFRGPIPETIGNLQKLTRITLSNNFFTGQIPRGIANFRRLEFLDLSGNQLSGSIPTNSSGMTRLMRLNLARNSLSGRILDISGQWQLSSLDLSDNQFYGEIPKLPSSLTYLDVSNNALSGHLTRLGTLQKLHYINVGGNRFTGPISQQVLGLPLVTYLNVSTNHFTEINTVYLSGPVQLQVLDAHGNLLHGRLPSNLAALQELTSLDLSHNRFSGNIPASYWQKQGRPWSRLFLQDNFLTGSLPEGLASCRVVARGSFANNCLSCPDYISLCRGAQKSSSQCARYENDSN